MWVLYQFKKRMNRTDVAPLYMQEVLLMTWGGMRGLVTLALVLSMLDAMVFAAERDALAPPRRLR